MGNVFSASEVVEMGIQIEKNGKDFYDELVRKTASQKAREIFEFLSSEEAKHITMFQNILDSVHKYEPTEAYPGEYFAYMESLASEYVFTQKDKGVEAAQNTGSDAEAVDLGIKFEKDSIAFYEGMKQVVHEAEHKVLDAMIAQEQEHLQKLSDLKKEL
jgi:rubrerythrin